MESSVVSEMYRLVDEYFYVEDFNRLLKQFIRDKSGEKSVWSDLTLYCHYMLGGSSPYITKVAALTELLILALDITDDLQDRDNVEKSWMRCPQELALNSVISFIFAALGELGKIKEADPSAVLPDAGRIGSYIVKSINGQYKDLNRSIDTEEDYVTAVREKSGSLIQFACYMGYSCLKDCAAQIREQIDEMAGCIGMIAQIDNDVKDVQRYDVKNDLLHKKRTLPILYLLKFSEEDFPLFKQFYEGAVSERDFLDKKREILQYIYDSGCIEYSRVIQLLYANRAEQLLAEIPAVSPWKEKFREITLGPFQTEQRSGESVV